jgi:hypothetical protein
MKQIINILFLVIFLCKANLSAMENKGYVQIELFSLLSLPQEIKIKIASWCLPKTKNIFRAYPKIPAILKSLKEQAI